MSDGRVMTGWSSTQLVQVPEADARIRRVLVMDGPDIDRLHDLLVDVLVLPAPEVRRPLKASGLLRLRGLLKVLAGAGKN